MSRLSRYCPVGTPQHVIQRDNNRSVCFTDDHDLAAYAHFLFDSQVVGELLEDIRQSVNQGLALGSERFRRKIEELGGRRQSLLKRGPKAAS